MPPTKASRHEPFDLESSIGFLLHKVHQRAFAEFRHLLEPTELTPPQFGVLALLYRQDGQSQAALCERGAVDPNTMVGIVDRLEAAGLVRRRRDPKDRRAHLVRITAKGRRMFEGCIPLQRRAVERVCRDLSADEQNRLRDLLHKMLPSSEPPTS